MPQAIAYAAAKVAAWAASAATAAGASAATASTIAAVASFATSTTLTLAANAAVSSLMASNQKLPTPESAQTSYKASRPLKQWGTGRLRLTGPALYWDNAPGWSNEVRAIHDGPIDGFEQFYLHDDKIERKGTGYVRSFPAGTTNKRYAEDLIYINGRVGNITETPSSLLVANSGGKWTSAHRGDATACIDMMFKAIAVEDLQRVYPNGEPEVTAVARLSKVFDWRDPTQSLTDPSTWKWTDNAVVTHLFWEWFGRYLRHAREDYVTPNAKQLKVWSRNFAPGLSAWTAAANVADEDVLLKAGGSEKRYRCSILIRGMQVADIRRAYLDSYDGRMFRSRDGVWRVVAGKYYAPAVTFGDHDILSVRWGRGKAAGERFNIIEGAFLSPANDYTSQAVHPWTDEVSIAQYGEKPHPFALTQVSSHGQARRLFKRRFLQLSASHSGELVLRLNAGLKILDEAHRFIRVQKSKGVTSLYDAVLEVTGDLTVDFANLLVRVPVRMANPNIDVWVPSIEEGFAPGETIRNEVMTVDAPVILELASESQGTSGVKILARIATPPNALFEYALSYQRVGTTHWTDGDFAPWEAISGGAMVRSIIIPAGATYNIRLKARVSNYVSAWSAEASIAVAGLGLTYPDGTPIEDLRPAQPGADKTSENTANDTANVNGRPSPEITADIDLNASTLLAYLYDLQTYKDYADALIHVDGQPVNAVMAQERIERIAGQNALAQDLSFVGAKNPAGTAWVLRDDVAVADGGYNYVLGQVLTQVRAESEEAVAEVNEIRGAVVSPSGGAVATAVLQLAANGRMVGVKATNDGTTGALDMEFDSYNFRLPNGTSLLRNEGGTIKMPSVEIDTLKVNSAVAPVRASASSTVSGTGAGNWQTVLTANVIMSKAGWVEGQFAGAQSFSSDTDWGLRLYINNTLVFETGGTRITDSVAMQDALYVAAAGTYPVRVDWAGNGAASLKRRSLFAKGYPSTN